jgi:hypothetical protein
MSSKHEYRSDIIEYEDHEVKIIYDEYGNIVDKDVRYYNYEDINLDEDLNATHGRR